MSRPGPKTEEGKARSSMNALKHGLYAKTPRAIEKVTKDMKTDFFTVMEEMCRHFRPADALEMQLVRRIARCIWRLALSEAMETRVMDRGVDRSRPAKSHDSILKYERLVDIHLHRAITSLQRKRQVEQKCNAQNENTPRLLRA